MVRRIGLRPVERLIPFLDKPLLDFVVHLDLDPFIQETDIQFPDQDIEDAIQLFLVQLVEDQQFRRCD